MDTEDDAGGSLAGCVVSAAGILVRSGHAAPLPLEGLTLAVTRPAAQATRLAASFALRGARAVVCPAIEIADPVDSEPLEAAAATIRSYDWLVITSANAVERFVDRINGPVEGVRVAVVGASTAAVARSRGVCVDLVPDDHDGESLADAIAAAGSLTGARVCVARAAGARDVLPERLRAAGAVVDAVDTHRTVRCEASRELVTSLVAARALGLVTFTSSSSVTNFAELAGAAGFAIPAACIGPVTAATARAAGFPVVAEAAPYTASGLVSAVEHWYKNV